MNERSDGPVLELLSGHWLSLIGAALVTTAGFSWPMQVRGRASNPYIGLVVFIAIPVIFCLGLALIPIGAYLGRRRIREGVANALDRKTALRRLGTFLGVTTFANLVIGPREPTGPWNTWRRCSSADRAAT